MFRTVPSPPHRQRHVRRLPAEDNPDAASHSLIPSRLTPGARDLGKSKIEIRKFSRLERTGTPPALGPPQAAPQRRNEYLRLQRAGRLEAPGFGPKVVVIGDGLPIQQRQLGL